MLVSLTLKIKILLFKSGNPNRPLNAAIYNLTICIKKKQHRIVIYHYLVVKE